MKYTVIAFEFFFRGPMMGMFPPEGVTLSQHPLVTKYGRPNKDIYVVVVGDRANVKPDSFNVLDSDVRDLIAGQVESVLASNIDQSFDERVPFPVFLQAKYGSVGVSWINHTTNFLMPEQVLKAMMGGQYGWMGGMVPNSIPRSGYMPPYYNPQAPFPGHEVSPWYVPQRGQCMPSPAMMPIPKRRTLKGRLDEGEILTTTTLMRNGMYLYKSSLDETTTGNVLVGAIPSVELVDHDKTMIPTECLLEDFDTLATCGEYYFREALIMLNDSVAAKKWVEKHIVSGNLKTTNLPTLDDEYVAMLFSRNVEDQPRCVSGTLFHYELTRHGISDGLLLSPKPDRAAVGYFKDQVIPSKTYELTAHQLIAVSMLLSAKQV